MDSQASFGHRAAPPGETPSYVGAADTLADPYLQVDADDDEPTGLSPTFLLCAGYGLGVVGLMLGLFLMVWPEAQRQPVVVDIVSVALLALTPLGFSLLLRAPESFSQHYLKPALIFACGAPAYALLLADSYRALATPTLSLAAAAAFAPVLAGMAWIAGRKLASTDVCNLVLVAAAVGAIYGSQAMVFVDSQFDGARPSIVPVQVLSKFRGRSSYSLGLSAWGPRSDQNSAPVSPAVFHASPVGGTVCINLHRGVLNQPWFTVETCW